MKIVLSLVIIFFCVTSVFAQEVISDWDDPAAELAGWVKSGTTAFTEYHSSGGNPGGHIRVYGNLKTGIKNTQPEFTGNYIQSNYNNISLDIMVNLQQLANFKPVVTIRYSPSFAGWNYELSAFNTNAGVWQHFDVYFDPTWSDAEAITAGWYLSPGPTKTFQETLEHVWAITVASAYPQITSKNLGYDNFKLSHVAPPPEPVEEVVEEPEEETGEGTSEPVVEEEESPEIKTIETMIKPIEIKSRVPISTRKVRTKR